MPYGAVQLDEDDDDKINRTDRNPENQQGNGDESAIREIEYKLFQLFATDEGAKVYTDFSGKIKNLLNARLKKKESRYSARASVRLMVRAAYRDYALRDILLEIVNNPVTDKTDSGGCGAADDRNRHVHRGPEVFAHPEPGLQKGI